MAVGGTQVTKQYDEYISNENYQEQNDELLALQSIYESGVKRIHILNSPSGSRDDGLYTVLIEIPVQPFDEGVKVKVEVFHDDVKARVRGETTPDPKLNRPQDGDKPGTFEVKYLPPLKLQVVLPSSYPSENGPEATLSCPWLTANQLSALCDQLEKLWEEAQNLPVLFSWIDWLENNIFSYLGIRDTVEVRVPDSTERGDPRIVVVQNISDAVASIKQYNSAQETAEFVKSSQECPVCCEEFPGSEFQRLDQCGHYLCAGCLIEFCLHHVTAGTVESIRCPDTTCDSTIPHHIVQSVLPAGVFDRWERLMFQKSLESMTDIDWCPRCNNPVIREAEEELNLGHCTTCFFSFCTQCRDPWHQGEICMSMEDRLNQVQNRAPAKNIEERERFAALKKKMEEEIETAKVMKAKNRKCPKCRSTIEKTGGCNKMTCRCGQSFCWVCGKSIAGYDHFVAGGCGLSDVTPQQPPRQPVRETPEAALWIQANLDVNPEAKKRLIACPTCRQRNLKQDKNNHIKCWGCKSNFCFLCKAKITGQVTSHFITGVCTQHS